MKKNFPGQNLCSGAFGGNIRPYTKQRARHRSPFLERPPPPPLLRPAPMPSPPAKQFSGRPMPTRTVCMRWGCFRVGNPGPTKSEWHPCCEKDVYMKRWCIQNPLRCAIAFHFRGAGLLCFSSHDLHFSLSQRLEAKSAWLFMLMSQVRLPLAMLVTERKGSSQYKPSPPT